MVENVDEMPTEPPVEPVDDDDPVDEPDAPEDEGTTPVDVPGPEAS